MAARRSRSRRAAPPACGSAASPWRMAEAEELRHTAENGRAEQALQVQAVWRPGVTTAALAGTEATATAPAPTPIKPDDGPAPVRRR